MAYWMTPACKQSRIFLISSSYDLKQLAMANHSNVSGKPSVSFSKVYGRDWDTFFFELEKRQLFAPSLSVPATFRKIQSF
jgi:hypothetical protein